MEKSTTENGFGEDLFGTGLMTVNDVIAFTSIGRTTLNSLTSSGELVSVTIGRRRLIPRSGLLRFLSSREEAGKKAVSRG